MLVNAGGRDTVGDDVVVDSPLSLKKRAENELIKEDYKIVEAVISNAKSLSLKRKMQEWLDEN